MSYSQKQLLKTMLFYELQNHVVIELDRLRAEGKDTEDLDTVRSYLENRISNIMKEPNQ